MEAKSNKNRNQKPPTKKVKKSKISPGLNALKKIKAVHVQALAIRTSLHKCHIHNEGPEETFQCILPHGRGEHPHIPEPKHQQDLEQ